MGKESVVHVTLKGEFSIITVKADQESAGNRSKKKDGTSPEARPSRFQGRATSTIARAPTN